MRRTKEDAELTKLEIIKAAVIIFKSKGYAATKLSDIAKEAGTTRGAIYWHFENKLDLYRYIIIGGIKEFRNIVDKNMTGEQPVLSRVKKLLMEFVNLNQEDESYFKLIKEVFLAVKVIPELQDTLKEMVEISLSIINKIAIEIQLEQESGGLKKTFDSEQLAITILNFLAVLGEKIGDHKDLKCITDKEINYDIDFFIDIIFNGLNSLTN